MTDNVFPQVGDSDKRLDHCPLCGGPNLCKSASPSCGGRPCWCRAQTFPAALLQQLPEKERDVRCICQNCLDRFLVEQASTDINTTGDE